MQTEAIIELKAQLSDCASTVDQLFNDLAKLARFAPHHAAPTHRSTDNNHPSERDGYATPHPR